MLDTEVTVRKIQGGGYLVRSRTVEGGFWMVDGADCTCPAGQAGVERCWHRMQVAAFVAEENRRFARPVVPPNVSALCD